MNKPVLLFALILVSLQLFIASCEKEKEIFTENLTQRKWKLVKGETHTYINGVPDTIVLSHKDISILFLANGEVNYYSEDIAEPSPMIGNWWFSDNKTILHTDLELEVSPAVFFQILPHSEIVELTATSLILKEKEVSVTKNSSNEEIKYFLYSHFSNK